jgi:serine/threonine-protein kinase
VDLTFGRYRALFPIASGGMAEVHAAVQIGESGFSKVVAVKRMLPHLAEDPDFVDMFLDEARVAVAIDSPHVVGTLDLGRDDGGAPYIVMDLVVGVSLAELLAGCKHERLPRGIAIEILAQAAVGLHDAHEATRPTGEPLHIVHRDVSPQNVLIGVDGIVRIGDFGIVQARERRTQTNAGQLKGKFQYFAPEQAMGKPLDRRSDVFALGIVCWEVLAGRRLFTATDDIALLHDVQHAAIPRLDDIPSPIADAVAKALDRDPAARYQTALELATALRVAARTAGDSSEPPSRDAIEAYIRRACGERIDRLESKLRDAFSAVDTSEAVTRTSTPRISDMQLASTRRSSNALDQPPTRSERRSSDALDRYPDRPSVPPTRNHRQRKKLLGLGVAAAIGIGGVVIGVAIASRGSSSSNAPPTELLDASRVSAVAVRACREWSGALAHFQQGNGAFAIEPHREPWGWTTAQELFPLVGAHRTCKQPGLAPLRLGLRALDTFRTPDGWTGADPKVAETPATAWAILAMAAAATVLDDGDQRAAAIAAREMLLIGQRADGGFRTRVRGAPDQPNGVSTVLALWALVELDRIAPAPDPAPRNRAAAWLRRALVEDLDEPPLRTTAGLHEQAAWVLLRARGLPGGATERDAELFVTVARDILERCRLGPDHRCSRPLYENGQTFLYREPGKRPHFLTLWHPWLVLLARELARDDGPIADAALRQQLALVADWGIREIEASIPSLTAAPGYKIAEYLIVANHIAAP